MRALWVSVVALLVGGLCTFLMGCGGEPEADTTFTAQEEAQMNQASVATAPTPTYKEGQTIEVKQQDDTDAILKMLNRELAKWMLANRRAPATFEEFVTSAQLKVPPPPAGKQWILSDDKRIRLANR